MNKENTHGPQKMTAGKRQSRNIFKKLTFSHNIYLIKFCLNNIKLALKITHSESSKHAFKREYIYMYINVYIVLLIYFLYN